MAIPVRQNKRTPSWGGGGGGASGPSGGAASMPGAGAAGPTGWVNVQDYLRANAPQAAQMGTNLASQLDTKAQTAAGQADAYRTQANTYANAPTETANPAWADWYKTVTGIQGSKAGGNPGVMDAYMSHQPSKTIPAPQVAAPSMPTAPGEVLQEIKAASTPAGLADYFQQHAGPTYNAGQGNLDSYLAGAGGGGKALQDLSTKYGNVLDLVRYPYPGAPPDSQTRPTGLGPDAGTYPSDAPQTGGMPPAAGERRKKNARIA
jgi:hypothetical protein